MSLSKERRKLLFLIHHTEDDIRGSKLPSRVQVLRVLEHFIRKDNGHVSVSDASAITADKVLMQWEKARIPTRQKCHVVKKIKTLHEEWRGLQRNASRRSQRQTDLEKAFTDQLDDLFDIAHANALEMIKNQEDKDFLASQRQKGRPGCMLSTRDMILHRKESRITARHLKEEERRKRHEEGSQESASRSAWGGGYEEMLSDSDDDDSATETRGQETVAVVQSNEGPRKKRARKNVYTPKLVASLDTSKLSVRKATAVVGATATALNNDIHELNVNKSSLHRARTSLRMENAQRVKDTFLARLDEDTKLTVHFDGKKMKVGNATQERLPVVVTGHNIEEQLLCAPLLRHGTGEAMACAVLEALETWGLTYRVQGMCSDTTSSMTGCDNGACKILERKLNRDLLYIACRHHMFEVVLKGVFEATVAVSSGPEVQLFKRFRESWSGIDTTLYDSGLTDQSMAPHLEQQGQDILTFALRKLNESNSRDDYREMLELTCIFLGGTPPRGVKFTPPGCIHDARFMSRALYGLKIWLFRRQFKLSRTEEAGLRDFCLFVVLLYVKAWFTATSAIQAPYHDFNFLKDLHRYEVVSKKISDVAVRKFCGHLWYLTPEWSSISLLDKSVPLDVKREMVAALHASEVSNAQSHPFSVGYKKLTVNPKRINDFERSDMKDFVSVDSLKMFQRYGLSAEFLSEDVDKWDENPSYQAAQSYFSDLSVVNDAAERAVGLTQEFLGQVKKEEYFQNEILVAQYHHRTMPFKTRTKSSLMKPLFE